jgi:hypothetical protein
VDGSVKIFSFDGLTFFIGTSWNSVEGRESFGALPYIIGTLVSSGDRDGHLGSGKLRNCYICFGDVFTENKYPIILCYRIVSSSPEYNLWSMGAAGF